MSAGGEGAFLRQAIAGEITPGRPNRGYATQDQLVGYYRFNSVDYDNLPTIAWDSVLTLFTMPGQGDVLIQGLECLKRPEEM